MLKISKPAFWIAILLMAIALGLLGYWMLFANFATYDDEGYILISARQYFLHGKLYEGVYTQYGPAFYCLTDALQRAFGPVDHTFARLLTLGFWLGAAICCSGLVWRQTASRALAFFTLSAVFLHLYFITDEPFHPGSLIFFVLSLSLWLSSELITAEKWGPTSFVLGASGVILLLTKINVGAFYIVGVAAWAISHGMSAPLRRLALPAVVGLLGLFAVFLMHTLINEAWVQIYLFVFGCGAIGLLITWRGEGVVRPRFFGEFSIAGIMTGLAVWVAIWWRGTSLGGLVEGVLLGPLRHPGNYSYPVDWRPGTLLLAAASLGLACAFPALKRRKGDDYADRIIIVVRLVAALALLVGVAVLINLRAIGAIFSYFTPLIWVWIVPLSRQPSKKSALGIRALLAAVLLLQFLHAYPVGGAQESWGSFLFIPLAALGLGDVRWWLSTQSPSSSVAWPAVAITLTLVAAAKTGATLRYAQNNYAARSALNLPGASGIHLPPLQAASYRILAINAVVHTDLLFSLPGMFSFNLWTGLPTPTDRNTTLWFNLLNQSEQQEIIRKCEASPQMGLIVQDDLLSLMAANHIHPQGVLWDYLQKDFVPAFKSEGFTFWTKRLHPIAPINIATLRRPMEVASTDGQRREWQLDFSTLGDGTGIAAVEFSNSRSGETLILDAHNAEATSMAITRDGRPAAPPRANEWPLQKKGLVHFTIRFNQDAFPFTPDRTLIVLRGSSGESVAELRIAE